MFNALLVRQALSQDGGLYLEPPAEGGRRCRSGGRAGFSSLEDARQEVDFVSYLPAEDLSGYDEFYSRMTYQEGSEHTLYLRWSWGYDDVTIRVELPEGDAEWGNLVDTARQKPTMCACTPSPGRTVCRKNTTTPSIPQCSGQWT